MIRLIKLTLLGATGYMVYQFVLGLTSPTAMREDRSAAQSTHGVVPGVGTMTEVPLFWATGAEDSLAAKTA